MKKLLLCFLLFSPFLLYAKELRIQKIRFDETMTYDKNDKFRYSPLNIFDKKNDTVYAVPKSGNFYDYTLILHFDKEYEFDEIDISGGYFDSRWYKKNYRIKKIDFRFLDEYGNDKTSEEFFLKDEMISQKLKFSKKQKASEIWLRVRELYPSSAYNDICISEMSIMNNGEEYNVVIRPAYSFYGSTYEYDDKGNLVKEKIDADHDHYELNYYKNGKSLIENLKYIDDDNTPRNYDYKIISNTDSYIEIVVGRKNIKLFYDGEKLIRSLINNSEGKTYEIKYYYKDGRLNNTDYGEFFYENGLLKGYIAYGYYGLNGEREIIEKINEEFCSYYLEYNDYNQIIERHVDSWAGYSAVY